MSEGSSECENERADDDGDVTVEGMDGEEEYEDDDNANLSGFEADLSTISLEVGLHFMLQHYHQCILGSRSCQG